jgi:hypothetical protein
MVGRSDSICTCAESRKPRNGGGIALGAAVADDGLLPLEHPELVHLAEAREFGAHALRLRQGNVLI